MAQFNTHKATAQGKAITLQRRTVRALKSGQANVNRSGHVRRAIA